MSFVRNGLRLLTNKPRTIGYLVRYGSRLKTENGVFLLRFGKRFFFKPKTVRFQAKVPRFMQIAEMVGPETKGYGTVQKLNKKTLSLNLIFHDFPFISKIIIHFPK